MLRTFDTSSEVLQQLTLSQGQATAETMTTAQKWIETLSEVITVNHLTWLDPLVNFSPLDEIVLEWWNGSRKLTIYIEDSGVEYIQVWGVSIDNEMADGDASAPSTVEVLWRWLLG
jgi:hypothetical protein